jgi:uncharacterized membrane protein YbhN (UPF0104 family)
MPSTATAPTELAGDLRYYSSVTESTRGAFLAKLRGIGERIRGSRIVQFALRHKKAIAIVVLVAFFVLVGVYIAVDPSIFLRAVSIGWKNIALLVVLYCAVICTNFGILLATVRLCGAKLGAREALLLIIYSTVANFFGPLQSGPGVRAAYLKTRIGLRFRDFTVATLFYYAAFGAFNVGLLFLVIAPWLSALAVIAVVAIIVFVWRRYKLGSRARALWVIAAVTLVQVVTMSTIFFVELNAVSSSFVSFVRALIYGGSANLSLFVSITPGGIGFREAFLVFARGLHHVPVDTIASAGIVDRAFYVLFLAALLIFSSLLHLRGRFVKNEAETVSDDVA